MGIFSFAEVNQSLRSLPAPEFQLRTISGVHIRRSQYRDRSCLVLLFLTAPEQPTQQEAAARLVAHSADFRHQGAELLIVVVGAFARAAPWLEGQRLPYHILSDERGQVHASYAALAGDSALDQPLLITLDRYGAARTLYTGPDALAQASIAAVLDDLATAELECPE